jgi:hypothetical protein
MNHIENMNETSREFLNTEEPPEGHLDRFGQKLKIQNQRRRFIHRVYSAARIAAIIIIVVISAVLIKYNQSAGKANNIAKLTETRELRETEQFYSRLLEISYDRIRQINFPDETQKAKILEDIKQKDESYSKIEEELQSDPSNELAQQAIINYYQTRLEVVNNIVANLKQVLNNNS